MELKSIFIHRKGFTLIELVAVIVIFGILLTAGTNVFFQVVMGANKASTEAELRQNASFVMEIVSRKIRAAGCFKIPSPSVLELYSDVGCSETPLAAFSVDSGGQFLMGGAQISSPKADFTGSSFAADGSQTVVVSLTVRSTGRWDYSGTITEIQTVAMRKGVY